MEEVYIPNNQHFETINGEVLSEPEVEREEINGESFPEERVERGQSGSDEINVLKEHYQKGLQTNQLQNHEELQEEIQVKISEKQRLERRGATNRVKEVQEEIDDLQSLLEEYHQILRLEEELAKERKRKEIEEHEKILLQGLRPLQIGVEDLEAEIEDTEERLKRCRERNRPRDIPELEAQLTNLLNLQALHKKIQCLKREPEEKEQSEERKENGLASEVELGTDSGEFDIRDKEELRNKLNKTKESWNNEPNPENKEEIKKTFLNILGQQRQLIEREKKARLNEQKEVNKREMERAEKMKDLREKMDAEQIDTFEVLAGEIKDLEDDLKKIDAVKQARKAQKKAEELKKFVDLRDAHNEIMESETRQKEFLENLTKQEEESQAELERISFEEELIDLLDQQELAFNCREDLANLIEENNEDLEKARRRGRRTGEFEERGKYLLQIKNLFDKLKTHEKEEEEVIQQEKKEEKKEEEERKEKIEENGERKSVSSQEDSSVEEVRPSSQKKAQASERKVNLKTVQEDANSIPESTEKILLKLILLFSCLENKQNLLEENETEQIERELVNLKAFLKKEQQETIAITDIVERIEKNMNMQKWKDAQEEVFKILKIIRPLDIHEIKRLIKLGDEAAKKIEGQNVILVIGGTGVGKSTTIHWLGGSKLKATTVNGLNHLAPVEIPNPFLANVDTSPYSESVTRYLALVPVKACDVGGLSNESFLLIDSPGFEDTNGPEVDIANMINIIRAMSRCKSVKVAVIINKYAVGKRSGSLKNLVRTIIGMIPGFAEHKKAFAFLFNQYEKDEKEAIFNFMKDIRDKLTTEEKNNDAFKDFITYLLQSTQITETSSGAFIIDPLNGNAGHLLDHFDQGLSQIKNPEDSFRPSISDSSKGSINDQLRRYQVGVSAALKRGDFDLIKYYLDQLKYLDELLEQPLIQQICSDSVSEIKNYLKDIYQNSVSAFNRSFSNENTLYAEDIHQYIVAIECFSKSAELRTSHLDEDTPHTGSLHQNLRLQVNNLIKDLKERKVGDSLMKIQVDKLKQLSTSGLSTVVESSYQEICQMLLAKLEISESSFTKSLQEHNFQECAEHMNTLLQAKISFRDHIDERILEEKYSGLQMRFTEKFFNNFTELQKETLSKDQLLEVDIKPLNSFLETLDAIKSTTALLPHINSSEIREWQTSITKKLESRSSSLSEKIKTTFKKQKEGAFPAIEKLFSELDLIRQISGMETKISQLYYSVLEEICGFVRQLRMEAQNISSAILSEKDSLDDGVYEKLRCYIQGLNSSKWIEKYKEGVYTEVMTDMENEIVNYLKRLQERLRFWDFGLENSDKLGEGVQIIKRVEKMKTLEAILPSLEKLRKEINESFNQNIQATMKIIQEMVNKWKNLYQQKTEEYVTISSSLDLKIAERILKYLENCKIHKILTNEISGLQFSVNEIISEYGNLMRKEMDKSFSEMATSEPKQVQENFYENAKVIVSNLEFMNEASEKYSRTYSLIESDRPLLAEWKSKLIRYQNDLSGDMESLHAANLNQKLIHKLAIARALSQCDEFLDSSHQFLSVYREFNGKYLESAPKNYEKIVEAIKERKYGNVLNAIKDMEGLNNTVSQSNVITLKKYINDSISQLLDETENLAKSMLRPVNLNYEKIQIFEKNILRMQTAKSFLKDYLENTDNIENRVKHMKDTVSKSMIDFIKLIKKKIQNYQFYEAKVQQDLINEMTILYSFDKIVLEEFKELETVQKEKVEHLKKIYQDLPIDQYFSRPPKEIFARLTGEDSARKNSQDFIFEDIIKEIESIILLKFREELDKAKGGESYDICRNFEAGLKYLPERLSLILEADLKHFREDQARDLDYYKKEMEDTLLSQNLGRIKAFLEKSKKQKNAAGIRKVQDWIMQEIIKVKGKVNDMLETADIDGALSDLRKLLEFKENFEHEAGKFFEEAVQAIIGTFQSNYNKFTRAFFNIQLSLITQEVVVATQANFNVIFKFFQLHNEFKKFKATEAFHADLAKKMKELNANLFKNLSEQQTKYDTASKNWDLTPMKTALGFANKWDGLINQVRNFLAILSEEENSTNQLKTLLSQWKNHEEIRQEISDKFIVLKNKILRLVMINQKTENYDKARAEFYEELNQDISLILDSRKFIDDDLSVNIIDMREECLKAVEGKVAEILKNAEAFLEKILCGLPDSDLKGDTRQLNILYANLLSAKQGIKCYKLETFNNLETIEKRLDGFVYCFIIQANDGKTPEVICGYLKKMKMIADSLLVFQPQVNKRIDELLSSFQAKQGVQGIAKLGVLLNQDAEGIGQTVISEHKIFEGYSRVLFQQKTQKHGIDHVINKVEGDALDKILLRKKYDEVDKVYQRDIEANLKPKVDLKNGIILDIKSLTTEVLYEEKDGKKAVVWNGTIKQNIPILIGKLFALWTLLNAQDYFDAENLTNQKQYLFTPHAAQIVAIIRILCIDQKQPKSKILENNLVQIGTGEGKSIVLAVVSSVLALLGYDVSCACYSDYLSQRDYNSFQPLFSALDIVKFIHYGTFNQMCERAINQNGDLRTIVEKLVLNKTEELDQALKQQISRPKIMLIDEVDVFFSKDFSGQLYTPSTKLRDATISSLLDYIWTNRKNNLTFQVVKDTDEFKNCHATLSEYSLIVEEAVKDMLFDLKSFESHQYIVKEDKIGYKDQDNIAFNISYGYSTLFAYYLENENGKISQESLDQNKALGVKCGNFSYAEMPGEFEHILGVTGTLKTLSDPEKAVIEQDYNIKRKSFMPSVFGESHFIFKEADDVKIENKDNYYKTITREVEEKILGKTPGSFRALLVIFESKLKLQEFYAAQTLISYSSQLSVLTEEANKIEKESLIKKATTAGQITLATKEFGRGTDFVCTDPILSANGGLHVVQTFLSEELSEETQIKGRTARQGNSGSYSMILLDTDLEKYLIFQEDIQHLKKGHGFWKSMWGKAQTEYDVLSEKRRVYFKTQYSENQKFVSSAKAEHNITQSFFRAIREKKFDVVKNFLKEKNKGASETSLSRTLLLMDATASMSSLLQKAKLTVGLMFERAQSILKDNYIQADCFQLQFNVFRNYDSTEDKLLMSSPWEIKPENLRAFLETVHAERGWGDEAIEIGLWHANQAAATEEGISQVILIGDAAPNPKDDVIYKRGKEKGEDYWKKTRFAQPTYYEDELAKLKEKKIPVHAFYVAQPAKESFAKISAETDGHCQELDIHSKSGADQLTDFVTEQILRNIGITSGKGDALAAAYRAKFINKSYT